MHPDGRDYPFIKSALVDNGNFYEQLISEKANLVKEIVSGVASEENTRSGISGTEIS